MIELVEQYQQQFDEQVDACVPWLDALRSNCWQHFKQLGIPSKKNEEWKYTDLTRLASLSFSGNKEKTTQLENVFSDPEAWQLNLIDGQWSTSSRALTAGLIVMPLKEALSQHGDLIERHLGKVADASHHAFTALNTAIHSQGLFIYVPEGMGVPDTLWLNHFCREGESAQIRHLIVLEKHSQLAVVETFQGQGCYFNNVVTEVVAKDFAKLTHHKVQAESDAAYHIGCVYADIHAQAEVLTHSFSFGGAIVRSDTHLKFVAEGGHCGMNGLYLVNEGQHVDHHTTAFHQHPRCTSDEYYKGILSGKSRAVFNGKVVVAKDAQKTDANQQNKNLLLSQQAEVDTKPQLEIFADDVKCAHGATVGQLDEDSVFYLRSRGLSHRQAKEFLIQAFVADRIEQVTLTPLKRCLKELVAKQRMV